MVSQNFLMKSKKMMISQSVREENTKICDEINGIGRGTHSTSEQVRGGASCDLSHLLRL